MNKLHIALIAIILTSLLVPSISTESSNVFIDYLTDIMWNDCQGKDIHINQPGVLSYNGTKQPGILLYPGTDSISVIKWPYDQSVIREIIRIFGENQQHFGTIIGDTCEHHPESLGCNILTAGTNRLDINGYNYFWNGVKVDVPQANLNIKTIYGPNGTMIDTRGPNSPVTIGPNSPINQQESNIWVQFFGSKGTIGGMIISSLIYIVVEYWKRSNKKSKKTK